MAWLNMLWHSPPSLQHENSKLQALYALASAALSLQLAVGGLVTDEELEELKWPNRQLHLPMAVEWQMAFGPFHRACTARCRIGTCPCRHCMLRMQAQGYPIRYCESRFKAAAGGRKVMRRGRDKHVILRRGISSSYANITVLIPKQRQPAPTTSNVGLVVEYNPATVETRVRFPDVAFFVMIPFLWYHYHFVVVSITFFVVSIP